MRGRRLIEIQHGSLAAIRDKIAALLTKHRVTVVKLNIDDNPMTPGRYGVRGIPTLMVFKDGKVASTKVGAMPKSKIVEWLNESV